MNRVFRFFIIGLMGLFLMGTGSFAVAAPQGRNLFKQHIAFQNKHQPAENSLVRPTKRPNPAWRQNNRQNTAREAMQSGRIVSLSVIRSRVRQSFPGKIIDVRLLEPKRNNQSYIYKVKLLRTNGNLLVVRLNAANGQIVSVKGNK
ncbi:MAG: hypothetical protein COA81_04005 [Alphaproteobacteria bacterium]|nr:MAG: hypothetical protein COA81_04005 [Alphaproteobacteria bacterium]